MRTTFTTTDHDEAMRLAHATDMCAFIWGFEQYLREKWKHEDLSGISGEALIDAIWDEWYGMKERDSIDLHKMWS